MSVQAMAWVWRQRLPERTKFLLLAIADHADDQGYCWPGMEHLGDKCEVTARAVARRIAALVRNGYLHKEQRRSANGAQRSNDYWILFNREPAPWVDISGDYGDFDEPESHGSDGDEAQDIEAEKPEPTDRQTLASASDPGAQGALRSDSRTLASCGQPDGSVRHKTLEPSESKPKKDSLPQAPLAAPAVAPPRGYKPPPPPSPGVQGSLDPLGVFVIETSRAYRAWQDYKTKELGRPWAHAYSHTLTHDVEFETANGKLVLKAGRSVRGRHFPSLFPPGHAPPAASPPATDDDFNPFEKTG